MALPQGKIYANLYSNPFIRFQSIAFRSWQQTNKRTDGRTKGQVENIMHRYSLDWRTDRYMYMFAVGIAFVHFYHDSMLSAIAKFVVHLIGEVEGQGETGEIRSRGRE